MPIHIAIILSAVFVFVHVELSHAEQATNPHAESGHADRTLPVQLGERDYENLAYNRDIRPILADKCFFCHGPDEEQRQADLRLDVEESAKEYAIVPGQPDDSELIARITSTDPELVMPPPESAKTLSNVEIEKLTQWIRAGAVYQPIWAYVSPVNHPPAQLPATRHDWPKNWIDHFIANRLEREGLAPSADADPTTLFRRLSFHLTGLPPPLEEVKAFQRDPSDESYEHYVDRLLNSDRFGERMASYWLDLVRYADTVGYHGDQIHNISPYRDYVIDAFNDNMPFDQFTREQLAGDLLPEPSIDATIASGYNRLLQTSHEGGVQAKEYLAIYMADRVRNFSAVWMGATMGCCQCHNHKYDPYTAKDFYALGAFFADIDEAQHLKSGGNSSPTKRLPEMSVLSKRDRAQLEQVQREIDRLNAELGDDEVPPADDPQLVKLKQFREGKQKIEARQRPTMVTSAIEPRVIRLLPRGNWLDDSGPVVSPQIPEFFAELGLAKQDTGTAETAVDDRRLTRLDLARWLTDPAEGVAGLTARVQVNRFWYLFFGTGIAKVLDDFGSQGQAPIHPELLDNLAVDFVESGWNLKHIIKTIVMSRAYRQSSAWTEELLEKDPYNQLFARQSQFRLPSEMIRDQSLAVSGLLVLDYGGPSINPYQPVGYYRHLNFPKRSYKPDEDAHQWRRAVYMHWQRQFLHPMLKATDAPSREECTAERPRSNTPLAALVVLNDPTFVEAARVFAERILVEPELKDEERLTKVFEEALFRSPDDIERETLMSLLQDQRGFYAGDPSAAEQLTKIGLSKRDDGLNAQELAAWTAVTRAMLNLNEMITLR